MMTVPAITVEELSGLIASGDDSLTILDVREPEELEIASLPNTLNIPLGQLPQNMASIPSEGRVVIMCHTGRRSANAVMYLQQQGITNTVNLTGGIHAWSTTIDSTVQTY